MDPLQILERAKRIHEEPAERNLAMSVLEGIPRRGESGLNRRESAAHGGKLRPKAAGERPVVLSPGEVLHESRQTHHRLAERAYRRVDLTERGEDGRESLNSRGF